MHFTGIKLCEFAFNDIHDGMFAILNFLQVLHFALLCKSAEVSNISTSK